MIGTNGSTMPHAPRGAAPAAAALAAAALLLAAAPAGAGLLGGGTAAAGAAHGVQKTQEETTRFVDRLLGDAIANLASTRDGGAIVSEVEGELEKTQGRLIGNSFPVLVGAKALKDSVAEKLKSARSRIERFVSGDGQAAVDERAALAIDDDGKKRGTGAEILGGGPLPASTGTVFVAKRSGPAAANAGAPGGWGKTGTGRSQTWTEWAANEHRTRPHCYGIVDPENMPADCPNRASVLKAASGTAGTGQASQGAGAGRGAGKSAAGSGAWSEWKKSKGYVSDVDRESAQVSAFALRCWGVSGVNEYHSFYPIMKKRMQQDDCLKEEAEGKRRGDSKKDYAAALADTLGGDGAAGGGGDYRKALGALEEREAERRRIEEEERAQQARLEEQRRLEAEEHEQQRRIALELERQRRSTWSGSQSSGGYSYGGSGERKITTRRTKRRGGGGNR